MSIDRRGMDAFGAQLETLGKDITEIMDELIVGEGVYAVKQARLICKSDAPDIVNTGDYRRNFDADKKAIRTGQSYRISVYNNLDYAKPLEYGFRSHFVPGRWEGNVFVHIPNDPEGGMFVGPKNGYVRGHFTLRRAVKRTKDTQAARLNRKMDRLIRERLKGKKATT